MHSAKDKPGRCLCHHPDDAPSGEIRSRDFDRFSSDLAMKMWNRIAAIPTFRRLKPKDFPSFFESVQKALRPYLRGSK